MTGQLAGRPHRYWKLCDDVMLVVLVTVIAQGMPEGTDVETLAKCTEIVHVVEDFLRAATSNARVLVEQLGAMA